ncbi:MAG: FtsX-like permease family protein, partial [Fulvivirga sp.]
SSNFQNTLTHIKKTWEKFYPSHDFSYFILKDFYNQQYASEFTFAKLMSAISTLSLVIACIGIYGVFMVVSSLKFKETALRKIFGASQFSLSLILFKDFFYLIIVSNFIGLPLAFFGVNAWLRDYSSRIDIGPWFFILPTAILIAITIIILAKLIYRTVSISPILAIREE